MGAGIQTGSALGMADESNGQAENYFEEPAKKLPVRRFDVVVVGYNYHSVCTAIDTEIYKLVAFEMLVEARVDVAVNTLLAGGIMEKSRIKGVIAESRSGREAILAMAFVATIMEGCRVGRMPKAIQLAASVKEMPQ